MSTRTREPFLAWEFITWPKDVDLNLKAAVESTCTQLHNASIVKLTAEQCIALLSVGWIFAHSIYVVGDDSSFGYSSNCISALNVRCEMSKHTNSLISGPDDIWIEFLGDEDQEKWTVDWSETLDEILKE